MIRPTDIHTLDSFRRQTRSHIERLHTTGRPEVLTVNGQPSVIVQDAATYQLAMERLEVLEVLAESVRQVEAGQVRDAREAIQSLMDELPVK